MAAAADEHGHEHDLAEFPHQGLPAVVSGKRVDAAPNFIADVVIVGGGLSGLTAALRLVQQKLRVVLLEASEHIGGRTRSMDVPEIGKISIGGTWAIFENKQILSLANEIKFPPFQPYTVVRKRNICATLYEAPQLLIFLWWKGKELVKQEKWWNTEEAKHLDRKSMEEWLQERILFSQAAVDAVRNWFLLMEDFPPLSTVSALYCAIFMYFRLAGIDILKSGFKLPFLLRWEGGTGEFISRIVGKLKSDEYRQFARIHGEKIVTHLTQLYVAAAADDISNRHVSYVGVEVRISDGVVINAPRVIVATNPMAAVMTIRYNPPLPEQQSNLFQSVLGSQNGSLNIILIWKSVETGGEGPWWLATNPPVGNVVLPDWMTPEGKDNTGVFGPVMDLSINGHGVLRILTLPHRVEGMSTEQIKQSFIKFISKYWVEGHRTGDENLRKLERVDHVIVWNWMTEMPTLPGVTFSIPAGALSTWGDWLTTPHGCIHWAGCERSFHGINWMEGAVARGNAVAKEVATALGRNETVFREADNKERYDKQAPPADAVKSFPAEIADDYLNIDKDIVLVAPNQVQQFLKTAHKWEETVKRYDPENTGCHCSLY